MASMYGILKQAHLSQQTAGFTNNKFQACRSNLQHSLGSVIEAWQSAPPYYGINLSLGTLLYLRVEQEIEETEPQGFCGGLRSSHEQVHADSQQLGLWKQTQGILLLLQDEEDTARRNI